MLSSQGSLRAVYPRPGCPQRWQQRSLPGAPHMRTHSGDWGGGGAAAVSSSTLVILSGSPLLPCASCDWWCVDGSGYVSCVLKPRPLLVYLCSAIDNCIRVSG